MSTITDEINVLKAILDLIHQVNTQEKFIGQDEVDSRLRWAAKNIADKIHNLSNVKG